jgi:hypothetical protein
MENSVNCFIEKSLEQTLSFSRFAVAANPIKSLRGKNSQHTAEFSKRTSKVTGKVSRFCGSVEPISWRFVSLLWNVYLAFAVIILSTPSGCFSKRLSSATLKRQRIKKSRNVNKKKTHFNKSPFLRLFIFVFYDEKGIS